MAFARAMAFARGGDQSWHLPVQWHLPEEATRHGICPCNGIRPGRRGICPWLAPGCIRWDTRSLCRSAGRAAQLGVELRPWPDSPPLRREHPPPLRRGSGAAAAWRWPGDACWRRPLEREKSSEFLNAGGRRNLLSRRQEAPPWEDICLISPVRVHIIIYGRPAVATGLMKIPLGWRCQAAQETILFNVRSPFLRPTLKGKTPNLKKDRLAAQPVQPPAALESNSGHTFPRRREPRRAEQRDELRAGGAGDDAGERARLAVERGRAVRRRDQPRAERKVADLTQRHASALGGRLEGEQKYK
eukprot:gene17180-biopygen371